MTCPKDADCSSKKCGAHSKRELFACTRKKGHKGKHHAHGLNYGVCFIAW